MAGFFDIHHHLIYGLDDDGPKTQDEMYAMINNAVGDGICDLVATSHVMPGIQPFRQNLYFERLEEARAYVETCGFELRLYPGAEVFYTPFACEHLSMGKVATLAGSHYVLIEFEPMVSYRDLSDACREIAQAGFVPVLAHTERYKCLVKRPSRVMEMKNSFPLKIQVNASIFLERNGFHLRNYINYIIKYNLLDVVASDAHGVKRRATNLQRAFDEVCDRYGYSYGNYLFSGFLL